VLRRGGGTLHEGVRDQALQRWDVSRPAKLDYPEMGKLSRPRFCSPQPWAHVSQSWGPSRPKDTVARSPSTKQTQYSLLVRPATSAQGLQCEFMARLCELSVSSSGQTEHGANHMYPKAPGASQASAIRVDLLAPTLAASPGGGIATFRAHDLKDACRPAHVPTKTTHTRKTY